MKNYRVLIISDSFAPRVSGSSILLKNLFSDFGHEIFACTNFSSKQNDPEFAPPCKTYTLKLPFKVIQKYQKRIIQKFPIIVFLFLGYHIIRKNPSILFIVYPMPPFTTVAFRLAKLFNIPYYVHMHDLWSENFPLNTYLGKEAKEWESRMFIDAKRIYCMTEFQMNHYQKRFPNLTNFEILPHTINFKNDFIKNKKEIKCIKKRVLFTGAISEQMNLDALKDFNKAIEFLPEDIEVLMCTSASKSHLEKLGIDNPRIQVKWVSKQEVESIQRESGLLFAPLSFVNCAELEVKTVFSTKILDYLISETPILVYAPSDSFHTFSALKGGWAYVLSEQNPRLLAQRIENLLVKDSNRHTKVLKNAEAEARNRSSEIYASKLFEHICIDLRS